MDLLDAESFSAADRIFPPPFAPYKFGIMFRTTATRVVPSSFTTLSTSYTRNAVTRIAQQAAFRTASRTVKVSPVLSLAVQKPKQKSLIRYASSKVVLGQDFEGEKALQTQKVGAHPELVSGDSSVHNAFSETGVTPPEQDVDMMAGVKSDFVCTKGAREYGIRG